MKTDKTIACWGNNLRGQADAPDGQYTAVSLGQSHSCGVKTDKTIACWGLNYGHTVDKTQLEHTVLTSGEYRIAPFSCEFRTKEELFCWIGEFNDHPAPPEYLVEGAATRIRSFFFDTWDREAVIASFSEEFNRQEPDDNWTGNIESCVAGTTSQEYRGSIFQRINWYRQMARAPQVFEDSELSMNAQSRALIMAAEGRLSHFPYSDWACYTRVGGFRSELLTLYSGIRGINSYMEDYGERNECVGHRFSVLDQEAMFFGTGDIPRGRMSDNRAANALHGSFRERDWREGDYQERHVYHTWPPPGYVPTQVVWPRWSVSTLLVPHTVEVANDNGPVDIEIICIDLHGRPLQPHGILVVWEMVGGDHRVPPGGDLCYTVTISGRQIYTQTERTYEYATCVFR